MAIPGSSIFLDMRSNCRACRGIHTWATINASIDSRRLGMMDNRTCLYDQQKNCRKFRDMYARMFHGQIGAPSFRDDGGLGIALREPDIKMRATEMHV